MYTLVELGRIYKKCGFPKRDIQLSTELAGIFSPEEEARFLDEVERSFDIRIGERASLRTLDDLCDYIEHFHHPL